MSPESYTAMTFQSPFCCLNNTLLELPKEDLCPLAKMFTASLTKHERREKGGNAGKTTQPRSCSFQPCPVIGYLGLPLAFTAPKASL